MRDGRRVESWFFPSGGDDPYAYVHVRDEAATAARRSSGSTVGTRITVPLAAGRPPANARLRRLVGQLVQLRPVLEDPARQLWLELPGEGAQLVTLPAPEPDPERPLLADEEIEVAAGRAGAGDRPARGRADPAEPVARDAPRRAGDPLRARRARDDARRPRGRAGHPASLRRGDLRRAGGAAARGARLAAAAGRRQGRSLRPQRAPPGRAQAATPRSSGCCARSWPTRSAAPARIWSAPGRAVQARDQVGLRALNDALRGAFDAPGGAGFERGGTPSDTPRVDGAPEHEPSAPSAPRLAGTRRGADRRAALQAVARPAASRRGPRRVARDRPGAGPARHAGRRHRRRRSAAEVLGRARRARAEPPRLVAA